MSEYQYYEFKAIDRPLTGRELQAIRRITSRAELTPTSFTNVYHWGNFRGDPIQMMERYYDAFVYVAIWGTHWFMLRLARRRVPIDSALPYQVKNVLGVHRTRDHVIFEFQSQLEDGEEADDGTGWMGTLVPLRDDLARGDFRCLYLAWLSAVQAGEVREGAPEPPVPPGLGKHSGSLAAFADFMRVDKRLIRAAAASSGRFAERRAPREALKAWIRELPRARKDALLRGWLEKNDARLRAKALADFDRSRASRGAPEAGSRPRRTAGELLAAAGLDDLESPI